MVGLARDFGESDYESFLDLLSRLYTFFHRQRQSSVHSHFQSLSYSNYLILVLADQSPVQQNVADQPLLS